MKRTISLIIACLCLLTVMAQPKREFRGAWIQCVNGQYLGKTPAQIRNMLSEQLDSLQQCNINTIIFQVRAEGDALYRSSYEPWSRFLTGTQGVAPEDGWDPLQWMVDQCHSRAMECHAWINPYRAKTKNTTVLAANHAAVRHPENVFAYGNLMIFNPAIEYNRHFTCMVVEDIVSRYDVDGIHIDDYFYPYPEPGVTIPDEQLYAQSDHNRFKTIGDWRRHNVNMLIEQMHQTIRDTKPWVKFGISPFGIYRNSEDRTNNPNGSATSGLQNYDDLYADIKLWTEKGWLDYLVPQIYWNIGTAAADYDVLCNWWNSYCSSRPLIIGQDVERTVKGFDPNDPRQHQMRAKYKIQRSLTNVQGSCQWYAAAVVNNPGNYATILKREMHRYPALQPEMAFLDKKKPSKPRDARIVFANGRAMLAWTAPKHKNERDIAVQYVVYVFRPGEKVNINRAQNIYKITTSTSIVLEGDLSDCTLAITALNHVKNESKPVKVKL